MNKKNIAHALRARLLRLSGVIAVLMASLFFASEAKGSLNIPLFLWGNSNTLGEFCATNTQNMGLTVYQGNNGNQADFSQNLAFGSVANINAAFQQLLSFAASNALNNPTINKNEPLYVSGYAWNDDYPPDPNGGWFPFITPYDPIASFSFIKANNGTWSIPDLSEISMILPYQIVTCVPGMTWCRIEVYSNGVTIPFLVSDSRSNSSVFDASIDLTNSSFTIDTAYLASGNTGPYRLKVYILTSSGYTIVDGNGLQVAETPFVIQTPSLAKGTVSFNVTGGNIGRVFMIQHSPDLIHWVTVGGPYTVNGNGVPFQEPEAGCSGTLTSLTIRNVALGGNRTISFEVFGPSNCMPFEIKRSSGLLGCPWYSVSPPLFKLNTNPMSFTEDIGPAESGKLGFYSVAPVPRMFYRTVTTNTVPQ